MRIIRSGILALVSWVLCLVVAVLWLRISSSSIRSEEIEFTMRGTLGVYSSDHGIGLLLGGRRSSDYPKQSFVVARTDNGNSAATFCFWAMYLHGNSWHGFGYVSVDVADQDYLFPRAQIVVVPHWFVTLILAILPAKWQLSYIVKRRRWISGRCIECGYDLRASKDRCPECGTVISEEAREHRDGISNSVD